ncbi:MAG: hypothetical protein DDG58_08915, partial [Ardenticatenia bacterium]
MIPDQRWSDPLQSIQREAEQAYELALLALQQAEQGVSIASATGYPYIDAVQKAAKAVKDAAETLLKSVEHASGAPADRFLGEVKVRYMDLRDALLRLAETHMKGARWKEARHVLAVLLENKQALYYTEACDLLCESYYQSGCAALKTENWEAAREDLAAVRR